MFTARFIQNADSIDYVAGSGGVAAGDVITFGGIVGVAKTDIPEGETGAIALDGVYDVVKVEGEAISSGAAVYFNTTSSAATPVSSDGVLMGHAIEAVVSSGAIVRIVLNK